MADAGDEEEWRRAGQVAARARELGVAHARPGVLRRELADEIERFIRDEGAEPAFPSNLSRNVEAAHYTPSPEDEQRLEVGDLLKVDVGAQVRGAIADTAATVEVGGGHRHENFRRAVRDAVEAGIAEVRPGVRVEAIGQAIQTAIHARGLKPIVDLSGHSIERYLLHAGKSIPNSVGMSSATLEEGEYIAIEPFATNGIGHIANGAFGNIVRFRGPPKGGPAELAPMYDRFRTLPFTARWVAPAMRRSLAAARRFVQVYPVFVEAGGGLVAQAEHTLRVTEGGAEVLTRAPPLDG